MDKVKLSHILCGTISPPLVSDLVDEFLAIRQDVATCSVGGSAAGKFVETLVQILQYLESGSFESKPEVDEYLRKLESRPSSLDDGLRICAVRIGRAMYTLRNKRNIAHKGDVDPNKYDLRFLHSSAQWIVAELVRVVSGGSMQEAGAIVEQIQAPVGGLVEDFGGRRLVLEDLPTREEILVLLHSFYPDTVPLVEIIKSLDRRNHKTVRNVLRALRGDRLVEGDSKKGYTLTLRGFQEAINVVRRCVEAA